MQLIQCSKGHYFDRDKFTRCPYCEEARSQERVTVPLDKTQESEQETVQKENVQKPEKVTTVSQETENLVEEASAVKIPEVPVIKEAPKMGEQQISQMWRAPEMNLNKQWNVGEDDNRTVSYYSRTIGVEPVVGWLVAIEGEYFGEAFKLKSGRNFVGRSPEMDIQLSLDLSVSRRRHAVIIYEPKSRIFIAQPGDSRELFYLNDEVVLNNVSLNAYDILVIGESRLLFIPLCGDRFNWDDVKKKNKSE